MHYIFLIGYAFITHGGVVKKHKFLCAIKWCLTLLFAFCYASSVLALEAMGAIQESRQIHQARQIIRSQPSKAAKQLKGTQEAIETEKELHNELGFDFNKAHISDLKTYWDYATLFYYRVNEYGKFGALINRLKKFGTTAEQYQLDVNPKITEQVYLALSIAESKKSQTNFPTTQYRLEGYFAAPNGIELSLGHGGRIYRNFSNQKLYFYTISAGLYFGNYFAWIRPTHHAPQSLMFYEAGLTRYFSDRYNYARVSINSGKLPDIGDLPPIDQLIVARQRPGINLGGQFAMMKCLYLRWGIGYAKVIYPNNLNRYICDAGLGLLWRF